MAGLEPLYDIVVLKANKHEKTEGGIVIPIAAQRDDNLMEVVAVGDGKLLEDGTLSPLKVKKGDIVLVDNIGLNKLEFDGEQLYVMRESQIIAIVK